MTADSIRNRYPNLTPEMAAGMFRAIRMSIVKDIQDRIQPLIEDGTTFRRVRLEQASWYTKLSADGQANRIGGGNMMIVSTMFSALSFLSKVNLWMVNGAQFVSDSSEKNDFETLTWLKENFKSLLATGSGEMPPGLLPETIWETIRKLRGRRAGECNETDAFEGLIREVERGKPTLAEALGIPIGEAKQLWALFRNPLAHMARCALGNQAIVYVIPVINGNDPNLSEIESVVGQGLQLHRAFHKEGDLFWVCNADQLLLCVSGILDWLTERLSECDDEGKVLKLKDWLNRQDDKSFKIQFNQGKA